MPEKTPAEKSVERIMEVVREAIKDAEVRGRAAGLNEARQIMRGKYDSKVP